MHTDQNGTRIKRIGRIPADEKKDSPRITRISYAPPHHAQVVGQHSYPTTQRSVIPTV